MAMFSGLPIRHFRLLIEKTPLENTAIVFVGTVHWAILEAVPVDAINERYGHDGSKRGNNQNRSKLPQKQTAATTFPRIHNDVIDCVNQAKYAGTHPLAIIAREPHSVWYRTVHATSDGEVGVDSGNPNSSNALQPKRETKYINENTYQHNIC